MDTNDIINDIRTRMAVLETQVTHEIGDLRGGLEATRGIADRLEKAVARLELEAGARVMSRRERTTAWSAMGVAAVSGGLALFERLLGAI